MNTESFATAADIINEIKKVIHGKDNVIKLTLAAILANGHVLLEDIPGVGKTTLAMSFSKVLGLSYKRMQFTPDVLPSDLVGFNMYDKNLGEFRFQEGAVYTNLFLADEINRTSPKTQSALLEVMEEGQATVEGVSRKLPTPFFVIATENPYGSSGTQKLPESQLDRFLISLSIGYPDKDNAIKILKGDSKYNLNSVKAITTSESLLALQAEVSSVFVHDELFEYIVAICDYTRNPDFFSLGLSPRGSRALLKMAKAVAFLANRNYVIPDDIQDIFYAVANHRVKLSQKQKATGADLKDILERLLIEIPVPVLETK